MSGAEAVAERSWLPKHKCADAETGRSEASERYSPVSLDSGTRNKRLSTRPGRKLREECVVEDDGERRALQWQQTVERWRAWIRDCQDSSAVFVDDLGNEVTAPLENRFLESRSAQQYAKLHDLERGVREDYGKRLNVGLLTLTASNASGAGDWLRCPANHLDDLLGSWSAVRRELSRVLDGRRWEYVRMLEPHKSGYAHVHVAVFVDGEIPEAAFGSVLDAHVGNCLPAAPEAHEVGEAAEVRRDLDSVAAYLSNYIMEWGENPLDAPQHVQQFNSLLWATGRRRVSYSQGAKRYTAFEPPESVGEWRLTHFEIRDERFPNNTEGDRVVMLPIDGNRGLDPPPDRGV